MWMVMLSNQTVFRKNLYGRSSVAAPLWQVDRAHSSRGGHRGPPVQVVSHFTSFVNRRYCDSKSSGVAAAERVKIRYLKVADCPGSSAKFSVCFPSLNTFWPRGFPAKSP